MSDTDALNRQSADTRYYLNTTTLDMIDNATNDVDVNGNRIVGLADATSDTDALNRQYADGRFY